jgi:hypothetical protein
VTARDEAIDVVITQAKVDRLDITVVDCMRLVDVLLQHHPSLLARLAIEQGALEPANRPRDDWPQLYRVVEP